MSPILDPTTTALVIVDVQNSFCHPRGSRARAVGETAARPTIELVDAVVTLLELTRAHGMPVWFTAMEYWPNDRSSSQRKIGTGLDRAGSSLDVCRAGTWDAELVEEITRRARPEDHLVVKHRSSAFFQTPLELQLRMAGVGTLLICGTTTSYCVESTVRDAHARDFDVVVPSDAVADTDPAAQEASLAAIDRFHGLVCRIEDVADFLGGVS